MKYFLDGLKAPFAASTTVPAEQIAVSYIVVIGGLLLLRS